MENIFDCRTSRLITNLSDHLKQIYIKNNHVRNNGRYCWESEIHHYFQLEEVKEENEPVKKEPAKEVSAKTAPTKKEPKVKVSKRKGEPAPKPEKLTDIDGVTEELAYALVNWGITSISALKDLRLADIKEIVEHSNLTFEDSVLRKIVRKTRK